jgi:hypothetical protein
MIPPKNNWSWCSGAILHFDIQNDVKQTIKAVARAITAKRLKPDKVNSSSSDHTVGWEDYTVDFLTAEEEENWENWELPGKSLLLF